MLKAAARTLAKTKLVRMNNALTMGWTEGMVYGRIPFLSPLLGMLKRWITETIAMFKEDVAR